MATSVVAQMRIKKTRKEMEITTLRIEAKGLCRAIVAGITPELNTIEEMNTISAAGSMDQLIAKQAEILFLQEEIWGLEKALGQ